MTTEKPTVGTAYARRLSGPTSVLHTRLEPDLSQRLSKAQDNKALIIKNTSRPSRSLIVRRSLAFYLDFIARANPAQLEAESLQLHKLA